jgi:hypothetical protein
MILRELCVAKFYDFRINFKWVTLFIYFYFFMKEVNIKYWFRNFHKIFFYWFSGRIRTFYRRKLDFYEKKTFRRSSVCCDLMAVQMKKRWLERCFQVRDFSFWITEVIGLTGVSFIFNLKNKFRRVAAIWIFGSLSIFKQYIDQF